MDENDEPDCETNDEIPDRCAADQPAVGSEPSNGKGKTIDEKGDNKQVEKAKSSASPPPSCNPSPVLSVVGHER